MSEGERQNASPISWNADTEVCLFYAMRGFKPVGINRHFHMMGIRSEFSRSMGQPVMSAQLWGHLSSMYNLSVLDESESLPFNNNVKHFQLPNEILSFEKETEKTKEMETPEKLAPPAKAVPVKESHVPGKTATVVKSSRKRTRNVATPSPGAIGPGANKRKRH